MSSSGRLVIKSTVESALHELSDVKYQQRVWVEGSTCETSSMAEAVEALFGDSCLNLALERNAIIFSPEADSELRKLHSLVRACLDAESKMGTAAVIASAEWTAVRTLATHILSMITGEKRGAGRELRY
jgi:hypothetical protein